MTNETQRTVIKVVASIIAIFVSALLIGECKMNRQTHDAVIRLEAEKNK